MRSYCMPTVAAVLSCSCLLGISKPVTASSAAGQETLIGIKGKDFVLLGADSSASSSITVTSNTIDKITLISNPFPFINSSLSGSSSSRSSSLSSSSSCIDNGTTRKRRQQSFSRQHQSQQMVIAIASAGDKADCDRLMGQLAIHASQLEYESGLGSDVLHVFHKDKNEDPALAACGEYGMLSGLDAETAAYLARERIAKSMRTQNRLSVCLLIGGMVPKILYSKMGFEYGGDGSFEPQIIKDKERGDIGILSTFADQIQAQVKAATSSLVVQVPYKEETSEPESSMGSDVGMEEYEYDPKLFWLDEYGSLLSVEYGAHGLGSNFILSILDRNYRSDLTREEGIQIIKDCFDQLRSRYIINSPRPPCIKCIDCLGCTRY